MAAHRKYDQHRDAIRRRRRAGETFTAIAAVLGIPRGTVSRLYAEDERRETAQAAAEAKRLARERAARERRAAILTDWKVSFNPHGTGAVFYDADHAEDHFFDRSLESLEGKMNWNDVRNGKLTPAEIRATSKGRPLFAVQPAKKPKAP